MKKSILLLFAVLCSTMALAQERGDMSVGVNIGGGMAYKGGYSDFGLGAKFQYNVTAPIRLELEGNYWFQKDSMSMWDLGLNANYLFNVYNRINVYPIVGLGVYGSHVDLGGFGSANDTFFGGRLGGGAEYRITDKLSAGLEIKYHILSKSMYHLTIQAGVAYTF